MTAQLTQPASPAPALRVRDLSVEYATPRGVVAAVSGLSFDIAAGEIFGLVGESGCGKSTTAYAILGLTQRPGKVAGGEVSVAGVDVRKLSEAELRSMRLATMAYVPQGAMNSLNPTATIGRQIAAAVHAHTPAAGRREEDDRLCTLLESVGLHPSVRHMHPHELSGGMKQRACIALAISLSPKLVIADEPTSALDVVVQRLVAHTLLDIRDRLGLSMLIIGHELSLMAQVADRVGVMYAGSLVEVGPSADVLAAPRHPYTRKLVQSVPRLGTRLSAAVDRVRVNEPRSDAPAGCVFTTQCPDATRLCGSAPPAWAAIGPAHHARCHHVEASA